MPILDLTELLVKGIRKEDRPNKAVPSLGTLRGAFVRPEGLSSTDDLVDVVSIIQGTNPSFRREFLYNSIFIGGDTRLITESDRIYYLSSSLEITQADFWDANSPLDGVDPTGLGAWYFTEYGTNWILSNSSCEAFKASLTDLPATMIQSAAVVNAHCYHKGRVLFGGFRSSDIQDLFPGKDERTVAWSSIGGGDVYAYLMSGTISDYLRDVFLRRGEAGYLSLPSEGTVFRLLPMGESVICYTSQGIFQLRFLGDRGYGFSKISEASLYSRDAVTGDDRAHWFVDSAGWLWRIASDGIERLGYRELFLPPVLAAWDVKLSFDPERMDVFISTKLDDDYWNSYVLTAQGLSELSRLVGSVTRNFDGLLGTCGLVDATRGFVLETDSFDMRSSEIKTVEAVRCGITSTGAITATLYSRTDSGSGWKDTSELVDRTGVSILVASGKEFKIRLESPGAVTLDHLSVSFRLGGRTYVR